MDVIRMMRKLISTNILQKTRFCHASFMCKVEWKSSMSPGGILPEE